MRKRNGYIFILSLALWIIVSVSLTSCKKNETIALVEITLMHDPYIRMKSDTLEHTLYDLKTIGQESRWVDNIENARHSFSDGPSMIYFNGVWKSGVL